MKRLPHLPKQQIDRIAKLLRLACDKRLKYRVVGKFAHRRNLQDEVSATARKHDQGATSVPRMRLLFQETRLDQMIDLKRDERSGDVEFRGELSDGRLRRVRDRHQDRILGRRHAHQRGVALARFEHCTRHLQEVVDQLPKAGIRLPVEETRQ